MVTFLKNQKRTRMSLVGLTKLRLTCYFWAEGEVAPHGQKLGYGQVQHTSSLSRSQMVAVKIIPGVANIDSRPPPPISFLLSPLLTHLSLY